MSASPSLPERLKDATAHAHRSIERTMDIDARLRSLADYRHLLARLYGFLAAWEPQVEPVIGDAAFVKARRKLPWLARDLQALGVDAGERDRLPRCLDPIPLHDYSAAMGSVYVIEGSMLGGRIIARKVHDALGLGPHNGCAYFSGYGEQVGTMWRELRARLHALPEASAESAVTAALATFATLERWLARGAYPDTVDAPSM